MAAPAVTYALEAIAVRGGVELAGTVPADPGIFEFDLQGKPIFELPVGSPAVASVFSILDAQKIP